MTSERGEQREVKGEGGRQTARREGGRGKEVPDYKGSRADAFELHFD